VYETKTKTKKETWSNSAESVLWVMSLTWSHCPLHKDYNLLSDTSKLFSRIYFI